MSVRTASYRKRFSLWPLALAINAIFLAACVFAVTQAVKHREAHVNELNQKILSEQQSMRILEAEWAYLTRPQRLEELIAMRQEKPDKDTTDAASVSQGTMKPETSPAPVSVKKKQAELAKIAPAAGPAIRQKPQRNSHAVVSADVKKPQNESPPRIAQKSPSVAGEKDFIWSPRKNPSHAVSAQSPAYPRRAGVARPILE